MVADMKHYIAKQAVTLHGGLLTLNPDQARRRAHRLKGTDDKEIFEIVQPIQFKAGEEFGFDGDVPKDLKEVMKISSGDGEQQESDKAGIADVVTTDEPAVKRRGRPKRS